MANDDSKSTRFKPGQSGNPSGRPKLPKDIVEAKSLNRVECQRILNRLISMNKAELSEHMERSDATSLELMIGAVIQQALKHGDYQRINFLLDRLVGKVTDNIQIKSGFKKTVKRLDGTIVEYSNESDDKDE